MVSQSFGSVTGWIEELKAQDPEAQRKIWHRFVARLVKFANKKLSNAKCSVVDAEDIASMAFYNFFEKTPEQFERLVNRNDLWQILTMLAERRAIDEQRKWFNQRNGSGRVVNESNIGPEQDDNLNGMDHFASVDAPPEIQIILAEEAKTRLDLLEDDVMCQIAIDKLQGYKNNEIAEKMMMSLRSVERKLSLIREILSKSSE